MDMRDVASLFKVFSDMNRMRILKMLETQKLCVCELAHVLGVTQPSVSRHIKQLVEAGLVTGVKSGFWTDYYLDITNPYAKVLYSNMAIWIDGKEEVLDDRERIKSLCRTDLCGCKK